MKQIAIIFLAGALLTACTQPVFNFTPTPSLPAGTLVPYHTGTPTPTRTAENPANITPSPTLSPTPFIHTVGAGEVFSAIAARYGLTVEELQAANPDVILSPFLAGQKLIIPGQGFTPTPAPPTPTPLPVESSTPLCHADSSGGAWCFLLVHNPLEMSLENLGAVLELTNPAGEVVATVTASGLLNLLPAGASLPLAVFVPQVSLPLQARVLELHALPVPAEDTRYLPARLEDLNVQIGSDGLSASVQGQIILEGETPASQTWVALTAYDINGKVIGVRRWESPSTIQPGVTGVLDGWVYSTGEQIARVDALVEARP